jgi:hypothetical protein
VKIPEVKSIGMKERRTNHEPRLWDPVSSDKNPGKIDNVNT